MPATAGPASARAGDKLPDPGDSVRPGDVEGRGREDQNRRVDEQREAEGDGRVDPGEADRLALTRRVGAKVRVWTIGGADRDYAASPSRR